MVKYVVTGITKDRGYRVRITKVFTTKKEALKRKKGFAEDVKIAIPEYKWVKALRIEEVK